MKILYEDKDIIVLVKPLGVASQMERGSAEDMVSILMNYFHKNGEKNPYVGVVHRLDKNVSGVMVYGKNKNATSKLSAAISGREAEKYYLAKIYNGDQLKDEDTLCDYLIRDGRINMSRVAAPDEINAKSGAKKAELIYRKKGKEIIDNVEITVVDIKLLTGRHHQIRVQFSNRGCPIVGDRKYGGDIENKIDSRGISLFCYRLKFRHPVSGKVMDFETQP